MKKIKSIVCASCGDTKAYLMISDGYMFNVNAEGEIIYNDDVDNVKNLKELLTRMNYNYDECFVTFGCDTCEDECAAVTTFDDGTTTTDEYETFYQFYDQENIKVEE